MPIKVLLVDDSPTSRQLLSRIIESTPDMKIVGEALDGLEAVRLVEKLSPDVVLMDVTMPRMDGLEATREIMNVKPTPIVVISGSVSAETNIAFEAINAGALSVLKKPGGPISANYDAAAKEIQSVVRAMAGVRVIRHSKPSRVPLRLSSDPPLPTTPQVNAKPEIVAIASSTGGPQTLAEILKALPPSFQLPVVIVQHISEDFVGPLVYWLSTVVSLPVRIAKQGDQPVPGTVFFAPGSRHLQITRDHYFSFTDVPSNVPHIPSGDVLLESVARNYGSRAIGAVLTGMGADGARGLRAMYDAGAMTVAQDEASCIVFGMPKEAIGLGAARQVLSPSQISQFLRQYLL